MIHDPDVVNEISLIYEINLKIYLKKLLIQYNPFKYTKKTITMC